MSDLNAVRARGEQLVLHYLGPDWSFGFDYAKQRAGKCDFTNRRVTLSKYLAARFDDAANEQTLLHEIAHGLAGPRAGHGPEWLRIARRIGYTGGRTHDGEVALEFAKWIGVCPAGHEVLRFRRPQAGRAMSCARCSRKFDRRFLLKWRERTPAERAASAPVAS